MKIYSGLPYKASGFFRSGTQRTGRKFCLVCAKDLPGGAVFPNDIEYPYVALYSGDDFDEIELILPSGNNFLLVSQRALEIIHQMAIPVKTYPALLRWKCMENSRQREMIGVVGAASFELDPKIFRMSRNVDCTGCGRTTWKWSGNQGIYPFKGARGSFHLFCLAGRVPMPLFSDELMSAFKKSNILGVPDLQCEVPFGEWVGE